MVRLTDKLQDLVNVVYRYIPQPTPSIEQLKKVKIVAHRGSWNLNDRLENTLQAFDHCLDKNIWAIEFDIRFTKDNIAVVHHDKSALRVFKKDFNIKDLSFKELRQEIPQIPTLSEVIDRYKSKLHLMIEIKEFLSKEQSETLMNNLYQLSPQQDYHLMSLNIDHFKTLHSLTSSTFVSIARTNIKEVYNQTIEKRIGALTGQFVLLNDAMKKECHQKRIKTGTGFPTSKNAFYREVSRDIDWVFTNHPLKLSKILEQHIK